MKTNDVRVLVVEEDVLEAIRDEIAQLREKVEGPVVKTWYTLKEAAELKGISYEVLRKLPPRYYPNFGRSQALVTGSRKYSHVYHHTDVREWLDMTEDDIDARYRAMLREEV